jgi:MYXO-CTERM domain-containing protein
MVAAGVGVTTPITLWVMAEGRYEPTSFPYFTISEDQLVWDFSTSSSNYKTLRQVGFDAANGKSWLIETATPFSQYQISSQLQGLAQNDPVGSGYGDAQGQGALTALNADMDKLFGGINAGMLWLTRMHAELPRAALVADLDLGASPTQTPVPGSMTAKHGINIPPCPTYPPCNTGGSGGGGGSSGGNGGSSSGSNDGPGCAVGNAADSSSAAGLLTVALAIAALRRRRAR